MQRFSLEILPDNLLKDVVPGAEGGDGDAALYHRGFPGAVGSLRRFRVRPERVGGGGFICTALTRCFQVKRLTVFFSLASSSR